MPTLEQMLDAADWLDEVDDDSAYREGNLAVAAWLREWVNNKRIRDAARKGGVRVSDLKKRLKQISSER